MEITNINQLDLNKTYTFADYLLWRFKERVELIKGKVLKMSPAPATIHQKISFRFGGIFYNFFITHQYQCLKEIFVYEKLH